jgi:hypothetical protein
MIFGFIALRMRDFAFFSFGWNRDAAQEEDAALGGSYLTGQAR